jgi:hypothetical protein
MHQYKRQISPLEQAKKMASMLIFYKITNIKKFLGRDHNIAKEHSVLGEKFMRQNLNSAP